MTNPLIKMLEETFAEIDTLSPEKLQTLIRETVVQFAALQEQIQSNDPEMRQKALDTTLALKETIAIQSEKFCEKIGLNPLQFHSYAEKALVASENDDEETVSLRNDLAAFRTRFKSAKAEKKRGKRAQKTWLVG